MKFKIILIIIFISLFQISDIKSLSSPALREINSGNLPINNALSISDEDIIQVLKGQGRSSLDDICLNMAEYFIETYKNSDNLYDVIYFLTVTFIHRRNSASLTSS